VDSPHKARFAFPELKVQLRSQRKENERIEKAREEIEAYKKRNDTEAIKDLPNPDSEEWSDFDSSTALAEGSLALHDLFTYAATNYKMKKFQTQLGGAKPLGLRINPPDHERSDAMAGSQDDKTVMLLTLELVCKGQDGKIDKKNLVEGRIAETDEFKNGMPNPIVKEREQFGRATVGLDPPPPYDICAVDLGLLMSILMSSDLQSCVLCRPLTASRYKRRRQQQREIMINLRLFFIISSNSSVGNNDYSQWIRTTARRVN